MYAILRALKNNFTLDSDYLRYAIRLALSCSCIIFMYKTYHLPNGYWAVYSIIACVWPTAGKSLQRTKQRILGTFVGMWFGILFAHFFGNNLFFLDIFLPIVVFLTFYFKIYNYTLYVMFVTVLAVLFMCLLIPGDWQVAIIRLVMTLLGTGIAVFATLYILPSNASMKFSQQHAVTKEALQNFYIKICHLYLRQSSPVFKTLRMKTHAKLQDIFSNVQEYRYEQGYKITQYQDQLQMYQNLEDIYRNLLTLEVQLPTRINNVELRAAIQPLDTIQLAISPLFLQSNVQETIVLQQRLTAILTIILQSRTAVSKDPLIQSATFYEHIQLTLYIKTLIKLLQTLNSHHNKG